jgi:ribosome biogenesis GTPase
MDILLTHLAPKTTAVLLGSSGAGKSTITNWLLNTDAQKVNSVREDDSRGRHTTTARQLFTLPSGAFLIDTPGMRELGILEDGDGDEEEVFSQIDELSAECEFSNCDHLKSKGCAVLEAIETGDLSERQLFNYLKLKLELISKENKNTKELTKVFKKKTKKVKRVYNERE